MLKPSQIANRFVTLASNKILIHSFESQRLTGDIHIDGDASGCLSATLSWITDKACVRMAKRHIDDKSIDASLSSLFREHAAMNHFLVVP